MRTAQGTMDHTAIALSFLCIAHCLFVPIAAALAPALLVIPLADEVFHQALIVGVLPVSILAIAMGCRKHRNWAVVLWCAVGLAVLLLTAAFGHDLLGEVGEKLATLLGASLIAFGHHRNYRLCQAAQCRRC